MNLMKSLLKKVAIVGVAVGAVIGGSMAYALWSSTATGSGNAKALSAVNVTVTAATGAADLYPGFTQGDVFFTLTNTNPYNISFSAMTPGAITSSDPTNCPSTNVTVTGATGLTLASAANTSNVARSIPDVVTMVTGAPDGCQGVTFTIALSLTGAQV
jgi:hypothetical protein